MALEHLHVVHVGLPVLDVALVVAGHHPLLVAAPYHRSDGAVVRLEDRLEVERKAVPKGELATRRACYQSATVGCPLKNMRIFLNYSS